MTAQSHPPFNPTPSGRRPGYDTDFYTFNYVYQYNDIIFDILLSPEIPPGYDITDAIERQCLETLESTGQCDGDNIEDIHRMMEESKRAEEEIGKNVLEVCKAMMQALAPEKGTKAPEIKSS